MEEARAQKTPKELEGHDPLRTMVTYIEMSPLMLRQEGTLKVRAYRGDLEIRLGTLRIRAQSPAVESKDEPPEAAPA